MLPGRVQPSTFGTEGLNFCVRDGNRWDPFVIATGNGDEIVSTRGTAAVPARLSACSPLPPSLPRFASLPAGLSARPPVRSFGSERFPQLLCTFRFTSLRRCFRTLTTAQDSFSDSPSDLFFVFFDLIRLRRVVPLFLLSAVSRFLL